MIKHTIPPIWGQFSGLYLWFYGLSYTLGFLSLFYWFTRRKEQLGMMPAEVRSLTLAVACGVLIGGRMIEVCFYENIFYFSHPHMIPAIWLGGMSTHGILLGATVAALWHCRRWRRNFLELADELAVPGACIMGFGRLGNFIDGQIAGAPTDLPWGVLFPELEGARHPVVLYDGIKNLLVFVFLIWLAHRRHPPRGAMLGHFIFWYGFLRIFIDLFREYRVDLLGLPPGQEFNLLMTLSGAGLLYYAYRHMPPRHSRRLRGGRDLAVRPALQWLWLSIVLALPNVMPSDWTYDVVTHYSGRYPMERSVWYPVIDPP